MFSSSSAFVQLVASPYLTTLYHNLTPFPVLDCPLKDGPASVDGRPYELERMYLLFINTGKQLFSVLNTRLLNLSVHYPFSGLPSIFRDRRIIGSPIPAAKAYSYGGFTTPFCDFRPASRVSRVKHEVSHNYYFVCLSCPSIKQSNDTMQKSHAALRCTGHEVVIVQRSAAEQFLQWLETRADSAQLRPKFSITTVLNTSILTCSP